MDLKVFTDNIEQEALDQINTLLAQDAFKDCKVRIMPDVHAGKGCVIGFTADLGKKVIPNIVGVDIGCLDKDTEVLTRNGWIKISDYDSQDILVYDKITGTAFFDKPYAYIKAPCDKFYHFNSAKGLDQMLSAEHKMLLWRGYKHSGYTQTIMLAEEYYKAHQEHPKSNFAIKTTFNIDNNGIDLSDEMIRVFAMVSADGCIREHSEKKMRVELNFTKERKVKRAEKLLAEAGLPYKEHTYPNRKTTFSVQIYDFHTKSMEMFYNASRKQLRVLIDEIYFWDGTIDVERDHKVFSTCSKINADVVQFALAANNIRAGIHPLVPDKDNWNTQYRVYQTKNEYVGFPSTPFSIVDSIDGFKYCFTTSTGFFIIRRGDNISITGNCGVRVVELGKVDIDLEKLDRVIREKVPSGRNVHEGRLQPFPEMQKMYCYRELQDARRLERSIGSLGGGNHFIEVDVDDDGNKYLVIHTGSRNLGKQVAEYYQNLAIDLMSGKDELFEKRDKIIAEYKAAGRKTEIQAALKQLNEEFKEKSPDIPRDLCYLEGKYRDNYLHDMYICQKFACINRAYISKIIQTEMSWNFPEGFESVHNYIEDNMVRKGAISAQRGERLIIPINMRDGSIIGTGKGVKDWNYSAPHGAGRIMSRSKAFETLDLADYKASMQGIYTTSVSAETIDEAPMAYKSMSEIIANIEPTVKIDRIIRPIYNFKASE